MFLRKKKPSRITQAASLKAARSRGLPVACVIDVGVQRETSSLIEAFPDKPHLLFEPVRDFHPDIRRNYAHIEHEIFELAISDADGEGFLQKSGRGDSVTHAWVSKAGDPVRLAKLDTVIRDAKRSGPFLLKIDVDGADAPAMIIEGAPAVLAETSCVVCEFVAARFMDLAARIARHGFILWDIVEPSYYDDVFYQCDAVFLRKDVIEENNGLRPFSMASFDPSKWKSIS